MGCPLGQPPDWARAGGCGDCPTDAVVNWAAPTLPGGADSLLEPDLAGAVCAVSSLRVRRFDPVGGGGRVLALDAAGPGVSVPCQPPFCGPACVYQRREVVPAAALTGGLASTRLLIETAGSGTLPPDARLTLFTELNCPVGN